MKTITSLLIILFCAKTLNTVGQENPSASVKKIRIHDFSIRGGTFSDNSINGSLTDSRSLAPNSVLLKEDFTGYRTLNGFATTNYGMLSVALGLQFRDKTKSTYRKNPVLRLGATYYTGTNFTAGFVNEISTPYDTLTSSQTGQVVYVDSTYRKTYGVNYRSNQLRLDGSLIYSTNKEARWSVYAGIGITAGLSINATTEIFYRTSQNAGYNFSNDITYHSNEHYDSSRDLETFRNKTNFSFSAYIPIGVDFRIGKKGLLNSMHLFFELAPLINSTVIPELHTLTNAGVQQSLGFKYVF